MVLESPASMECTVDKIITLGEHGGAGHLIICKIHRLHVREEAIDENDRINPHKMDLMGRMGRAFYCRASGENVFPIVQAVAKICIGFDRLPDAIRKSEILTGNEIAMLAGMYEIPSQELISKSKIDHVYKSEKEKHVNIKTLLKEDRLVEALALSFS
jgi:hypothetical protein